MKMSNEGPSTSAACRPTGAEALRRSWGWALGIAALVLVVLGVVGGTALARWLQDPGSPPAETAAPALKVPPRLFPGWNKPELLLLLSAQQHGYVLPCGCSWPQIGGLERRYGLMQMIRKQKGWPLMALDLGDVPQKHGPVHLPNLQGLIKYRYTMRALELMGYAAVGIGEYEAHLGLFDVLGAWSLNNPKPTVLAGNLEELTNFPGWESHKVYQAAGSNLTVGVAHIVGPTAARGIKDPAARFAKTQDTLNAVLASESMKAANLRVLLYHGTPRINPRTQTAEAVAVARAYPQFPVILCLSEEDEPPANPTVVTLKNGQRSMIFSLGHKGKYVGALGIYRTGQPDQPFTFRYQLVELTEDYLTPKGQEASNPVLGLMEEYTRELRDQNYLEKYSQTKHVLQVMDPVPNLNRPGKAAYVGSLACKKCHALQYDIWKASRHSHAYTTLVTVAKRPSNRQYDPECVVCHTVGFGYETGFVSAAKTPSLTDVGCESCHGPASLHVANPNNQEWRRRMNLEWQADTPKAKEEKIDRFCQKCHDIDNDVTWKHNAFHRKWVDGKIIHNNDQ